MEEGLLNEPWAPKTHAQSQEEKKRPCASPGEKAYLPEGSKVSPLWPWLFVCSVGHHLDLFLIVDADLKYAFVTAGEVEIIY